MILAAGADGTPACLNKYQALSLQAHIIRSTPDLLYFTDDICLYMLIKHFKVPVAAADLACVRLVSVGEILTFLY